MIYLPLFVFSVVFFELFVRLRLAADASSIVRKSRDAMGVLASATLGDDEKEILARRSSLQIFQSTALFAAKFALIGAVLYLLYVAFVAVFPARRQEFLAALVSPVALLILTASVAGYAWLRKSVLRKR
jgi:hypothetical protein